MKANRNIYRALLLVSFIGLNICILFGISAVWSYLNTGADRSSRLHLYEELDAAYLPKVVWEEGNNEGRPMEEPTLQKIEGDYLNAWHIRNIAQATNAKDGIPDFYTDSARLKLYRILDFNRQAGITTKSTTIEHHPKLEFYSEDGQQVVFTDKNVYQHEEVYLNDTLVSKQKDTTSYQVMMLLEDGFWRIRHQVKIPSNPEKKPTENRKFKHSNEQVLNQKGINYYPQETPWNMFGKYFNDSIIEADFLLMKKMGLNTLRIFVPYESFGKAQILEKKLEQLRATLDLAKKHDLLVVVTLFDFYGDYEPLDWTLTHRHAEQIVTTFKDHDAIIAWDLKNEPDLDFESRGKEKVLDWLTQMTTQVKEWDPNHRITIGWSSPEAATNLSDRVDFVSFHYYKEVSQFRDAYKALKEVIPNKPLVLQEYGYSSYGGLWNAFSGSSEKQAAYYAEIQPILHKEKIPFILWTLYDFEEIPTAVVGRLPWRKQRQKYFGLIDTEGNPKSSFQLITTD